jgi:DNA adenine methylase
MTEHSIKQGSATARPFLKWAGGKYRLLDPIRKLLPSRALLIEPFVGAGAVFLNLPFDGYHLNDINSDLIHLYRILQQDGSSFIPETKRLFSKANNTANGYYRLRDRFNASQDPYERARLFVFLNRHGFNGLCRFNLSGGFNVPFGHYEKPYFPQKELENFITQIQKAHITCEHFQQCMDEAPAQSVIYCDPPYVPLSKTANFTGYAAQRFTMEDQEQLADCAEKAAQRGCVVLVSNHDTPFTRKLYHAAKCRTVQAARVISCRGSGRKKVREILALYS